MCIRDRCNRIKVLMGMHSYYLYDETLMTASYARWAFLAAEDNPVVVKVGFKSRGCLAMTGCASAICSMIEGKTFSQALELTPKDVELAVDGVPKGKGHTTLFAIEAVRGLVGDWMYRCGMPLAEMNEKLPCDEMSVACLMCEHCSLRDTRVEMRINEAIAKQKAGEAK